MQRFFVEQRLAEVTDGAVALPAHVSRQVATVLRMRPGDPLVLFDGTGGEWEAELSRLGQGGRTAQARLVRHREPDTEPPLRVTLCQALLKGDRLEWVLQKGTELGVARFVLLVTQRVVAGREGRSAEGGGAADFESTTGRPARWQRWQRIVTEAAEQSGRTIVPVIEAPQALTAALATGEPGVFCWEEERRRPFLDAFRAAVAAGDGAARVFIGPEGGFTAAEAQVARECGMEHATLGRRPLRSETAAVAALALALLALDSPQEA